MTVLIGALEFDGLHTDVSLLSNTPGIYAVLCNNDEEYELLELGQSDDVRKQVLDQCNDWKEDGRDIAIAVHYTGDLPADVRIELIDEIQLEFELELAA